MSKWVKRYFVLFTRPILLHAGPRETSVSPHSLLHSTGSLPLHYIPLKRAAPPATRLVFGRFRRASGMTGKLIISER